MKTKVWMVIWGLKDGGAEVLARDYARLADPEHFDSTIVTMYPFTDTANYRQAAAAGLKILPVFKKRNTLTRAVRVLLGRWYVPFALGRMIAREAPEAIHFNSPMAHYFVSLKKQLRNVNLLYTCHSEPDKHFSDSEAAAVRQMIRDHDLRLIALHDDMKQELDQRFGITDTAVIRNGVDLARFRQEGRDRADTRQSIGIPRDAWVAGHVGRFTEAKNHAFLLEVFQQILRRKPNAHLLLVGSGELKEEITQSIGRMGLQERVTILSHRSDIPDLLRAMDVMVFPSFYEGLSVTLVEAQASGLRCVISDTINPANLLSEKTIPMSLAADAGEWAAAALDEGRRNGSFGNIEDYDMNREIRRLERLYRGERDG